MKFKIEGEPLEIVKGSRGDISIPVLDTNGYSPLSEIVDAGTIKINLEGDSNWLELAATVNAAGVVTAPYTAVQSETLKKGLTNIELSFIENAETEPTIGILKNALKVYDAGSV